MANDKYGLVPDSILGLYRIVERVVSRKIEEYDTILEEIRREVSKVSSDISELKSHLGYESGLERKAIEETTEKSKTRVSILEAARICGVTDASIHITIKKKGIFSEKVGRKKFIFLEDLIPHFEGSIRRDKADVALTNIRQYLESQNSFYEGIEEKTSEDEDSTNGRLSPNEAKDFLGLEYLSDLGRLADEGTVFPRNDGTGTYFLKEELDKIKQ